MDNSVNLKRTVESFFSKNVHIILTFTLVLTFLLYLSNKIQLKQQNCSKIKKLNKNLTFYSFNELRKANYFKTGTRNNYNCKLKDFYFKGAYNCFCSGGFRNDYVDVCALKNCSRSGVRFLDMQVFSLNNLPIIAVNHNDSFFQKESFNDIDFDKGMKKINSLFLNDKGDFPLFIHLRLNYASSTENQNNNMKVIFYNQLHDVLIKVFDKNDQLFAKNQRLFYTDFDDSREEIIANLPIESCQNKVFIFITLNDNSSNSDNFKKSKLNEITDLLSTGEQSLAILRSDEITEENNISFKALTKKKLVVSFPQANTISTTNYDFSNAVANGVQFICMNHQIPDSMLTVYNDFFVSQIGSSSQNMSSPMIKKPDMLLNTALSKDSLFIPSMTYKIMTETDTDNLVCHDASSNDVDPVVCEDVSSSNYQLFNIYQSPDNADNYYFKTTIQEKICDLSGNNLLYCNLNAPDKTSYFNFTRTGADTYKISDISNNRFCKLNIHDELECNEENETDGTNFSIRKTLL